MTNFWSHSRVHRCSRREQGKSRVGDSAYSPPSRRMRARSYGAGRQAPPGSPAQLPEARAVRRGAPRLRGCGAAGSGARPPPRGSEFRRRESLHGCVPPHGAYPPVREGSAAVSVGLRSRRSQVRILSGALRKSRTPVADLRRGFRFGSAGPGRARSAGGCTQPRDPPGSTRGCQWIGADSRVHTAADMLFRFHVHTPGQSRPVIDGKTEVQDAIPRLRSLRPVAATHV
jgi:hypothetical protein